MFMLVIIQTMKYWKISFQRKNYIIMNLFWKDKLKLVMITVNVMKTCFSYNITVSV